MTVFDYFAQKEAEKQRARTEAEKKAAEEREAFKKEAREIALAAVRGEKLAAEQVDLDVEEEGGSDE